MKTVLIRFFTNRYFLYALFWIYNGIYLLFVSTASPFLFRELSSAAQEIPWNVAMVAYILILTPVLAVVLGTFTRLRKDPKKLVTLLFCVEIPLIFLALIRLIFIRQITPILWYFIVGGFISVAGVFFILFKEHARTKGRQILYALSQGIALMLAGYGALLAAFFLPIIIAFVIRGIITFPYAVMWETLVVTKGLAFFSVLFSILLAIVTVGFFLVAPVVTTTLYYRSFRATLARLREQIAPRIVTWTTSGVAVLFILIGVLLSLQPRADEERQYADLISRQADTFTEQQQLAALFVRHTEETRRALLTAYLAQYRYIGDATTNLITKGYKSEIGFTTENAEIFQGLFNMLAGPFIYRGTFDDDVERAEMQYRALFDAHIQEGEKDAIRRALASTNTSDPLKADLLDRDAKRVHVTARNITIQTHAETGMAVVQVEETYENTTDENQEVFYTFSLPETAVVTALRLGPSLEYEGVISPKGAARRTYERQITRQWPIDPALLEQVGPRQYTLRVFPIPPEGRTVTGTQVADGVENKPQRIMFEYAVPGITRDIPLPMVTEERNAYRDQKTIERTTVDGDNADVRNGVAIRSTQMPCPASVSQAPVPGMPGQAFLYVPHGQNPLVRDRWSCANALGDPLASVNGLRIALLIDVSYSNRHLNIPAFLNERMPLARLAEQGNNVDLFYFNTLLSDRMALTPESIARLSAPIPFGGTDRIRALDALPAGYDAILLVTDASAEDEPTDIAQQNVASRTPLYLVHPDGSFPAYHDALTHRMLMSHGSVVSSPEEALAHLGTARKLQELGLTPAADAAPDTTTIMRADANGAWLHASVPENGLLPWLNGNVTTATIAPDAFQKIATAVWARSMIAEGQPAADIHRMVEQAPVVTPYSSFIALVTDRQRSQLEREEQEDDAFLTVFDTGAESIASPAGKGMLTAGAVPEPAEWLLIFCGIGLLLIHQRRRIFALLPMSKNRG